MKKRFLWLLLPALTACAGQSASSAGISRETAIEIAKKDCGAAVPPKDEGHWHVKRDGDFWYVGFQLSGGKSKGEPDYLEIWIHIRDGMTEGCAITTS